MTNKEAIEHIKEILLKSRSNKLNIVTHGEEIALDLAIKALEVYKARPQGKMKTTSKERRDAAIVKTVERILSQAERPIETDISIRIRQDEVVIVNYYIKEAIIPKEETEEADNEQ